MMNRAWGLILLWMAAGCVPATTPPQLDYTPGVPIVVTDGRYDAGAFSAMRPDGWRVITSAADATLSVIFVSPDDSALILLSTEGIGEPPQPDADTPLRDITREVQHGAVTVYGYGVAPSDGWDSFSSTFEAVIASLGD